MTNMTTSDNNIMRITSRNTRDNMRITSEDH